MTQEELFGLMRKYGNLRRKVGEWDWNIRSNPPAIVPRALVEQVVGFSHRLRCVAGDGVVPTEYTLDEGASR